MSAPAAPDAFERVLDALGRNGRVVQKRREDQAAATCPAHEDGTASLSVSRADAAALVHCHAGCSVDDVLGAIGLRRRDLFDEPRAQQAGYVVTATYDYTDERGSVLYGKERRWPKDFRQFRPRADGGRDYTLGTVRRVLYRLPAVLEAIRAGQEIWVCEGEKDADALAGRGVCATTWPEGAWQPGARSKWRKSYTETLTGAVVVVVADRDEPGLHTAREIAAELAPVARGVRVVQAKEGKDAADHIAAGHGLADFPSVELDSGDEPEVGRRVVLTPASEIRPARPRWLWEGRWPMGELSLIAGRAGLGKSTVTYDAAARLTCGTLPGEMAGTPSSVLVCATEDSWAHTIVPRLMAAGAALDRVFAIEVKIGDHDGWLSLPADLDAIGSLALEHGASLLILDPLVSRLDGGLDTHKDADVRRALEPLKRLATRANLAVLGVIHQSKGGTDPVGSVMGSVAFAAVARSVTVVVADPDDEAGRRRLLGTPKNNLGRDDLPTLGFTIEPVSIHTDDGPTEIGAVRWTGEVDASIREAMSRSNEDEDTRTSRAAAAEWLTSWLESEGGSAPRKAVVAAAREAGWSEDQLKRCHRTARVTIRNEGFPRTTIWSIDVQSVQSEQSEQPPARVPQLRPVGAPSRGHALTAPTAPTGADLAFRANSTAPTGTESGCSHCADGIPCQSCLLDREPAL